MGLKIGCWAEQQKQNTQKSAITILFNAGLLMFSCVLNVLLKSINCHVIFNLWLSSTTFLYHPLLIPQFCALWCVPYQKFSSQKSSFLVICFRVYILVFLLIHIQYTASNNGRPWEFFQVISYFLLFKSIIKLIKVKRVLSLSISLTHSLFLTLSWWYDNKQKEVKERKKLI